MSLNSLTRLTTTTVKKEKPFGAHFTTRLEGVNSKLVCALGANWGTTCTDDPIQCENCHIP